MRRPQLRKVIRQAMREREIASVLLLAKQAGVARNTIYNWEGGATSPALDELEKVARQLGLPLSRLVDAWNGRAPATEESPPAWAEGLVRMTVAEVLDGPAIDAWIARVEALRAQRLRDRDEDQASDDPPGAAGASVPSADQ